MAKQSTQIEIERKLPANVDAERALLGAMIVSETMAVEGIPLVDAGDFFLDSHRRTFSAVEQMVRAGRSVDLVTLTDFLSGSGQIERVGGVGYIAGLIDGVPRTTNVASYAAIVREKARLRGVIAEANRLAERAFGEEDSARIVEDGVSSLLRVGSDDAGESLPRPWREVSQSAFEQVEFEARNPGLARRFRCQFPDLDEITGSQRPQELAIIVGQSSHGKTVLAEQYVSDAAARGLQVLVFSAEMRAETLALRQMARDAGIRFLWIRRPENMLANHGEDALRRLGEQAGRDLPVWIVDRKITPASIRATAEARKRLGGLDMIVVDYDQLVVRATSPKDEFSAQAQFVAECLDTAKRLDVCYILLCQPRKVDIEVARGKRGPRLEDVFGSSAVGNTAHSVLWVMREFFQHDMDVAYERKGKVWVLKARNDRTGVIRAEFDPDHMRWQNAPPSEEDSIPDPEESKRKRGRGNVSSTWAQVTGAQSEVDYGGTDGIDG